MKLYKTKTKPLPSTSEMGYLMCFTLKKHLAYTLYFQLPGVWTGKIKLTIPINMKT